jgi:hypothetical protein
MGDAAAAYRSRAGIALGHVDHPETPQVEEFVEVSPTGQAEVVETEVEDEEDED